MTENVWVDDGFVSAPHRGGHPEGAAWRMGWGAIPAICVVRPVLTSHTRGRGALRGIPGSERYRLAEGAKDCHRLTVVHSKMGFGTCKTLAVLGLLLACCTSRALGFSSAPPPMRIRVSGAQHAPQAMVGLSILRSGTSARGQSVLLRAAGSDKEAQMKMLEKEAEEVIEEAERLWKEALEARDNADQLCTIAEELAADTESKVPPPPQVSLV